MEYKENHHKIVTELLSGKFILWTEPHFIDIEKQKADYALFFEKSFGYSLKVKETFAYLESANTKEKFSIEFSIFLAVLCYNISLQGYDIENKIKQGYFDISDIQEMISNPSYEDIFERLSINAEKITRFLNSLSNRNIIEFDKNQKEVFSFTSAIDLFFEFSRELANEQIKQFVKNEEPKVI